MAVRASLPTNVDAARSYSTALSRLRLFDAVGTRYLLLKAITAEPDFPLRNSALAATWSVLGYDQKATEEAKKGLDLAGNLSREDRRFVEARYYEMARNWEKAIETYQSLRVFFPDNLDYGLRLADVQTLAGKGKDALTTRGGVEGTSLATAR